MQHSPSEIKEKLLGALDKDYNVVDMDTVFEVVSTLERIHITKEALEKTRLGKYINELRRKTNNEHLARRIKDLVKSWRRLIPQAENSTTVNGERIAGGITPPGPGPGSGSRVNSAVVTNTLSGLTSNSRIRPASPTVSYDRLTSPLSLSASNSPLLQPSSRTIGGNRPVTPNTYAPIRSTVPTNTRQSNVTDDSFSPMPGQANSGLHAMSNVFKPVSPALQAVKQSMTANRCSTPNSNLSPVAYPKPNSPVVVTSSKSPYNNASGKKTLPKSSVTSNDNSFPSTVQPSVVTDESIHSRLNIAKTNSANKRLRKNFDNEDDADSVNGISHPNKKANMVSDSVNGLDTSHNNPPSVKASKFSAFETIKSSVDASPSDMILGEACLSDASAIIKSANDNNPVPTLLKVMKKRGRKSKKKQDPHDILKEKIGLATAQGSGIHKVKTTQQLIEDLQAKNVVTPGSLKVSTPPPAPEDSFKPSAGKHRTTSNHPFPSSDAETTKAKSELMDRFLRSTSVGRPGPSISPDIHKYDHTDNDAQDKQRTYINKTPTKIDEEINKILSALPKVDPIVLEDDEESAEGEDHEVVSERDDVVRDKDVTRVIEDEWEFVNGVHDHDGQWREWQDTATRASQNGDLLHILPYVNIDW